MSRHGALLPIPEGSPISEAMKALLGLWEQGWYADDPWPRSAWLKEAEGALIRTYPQSSSADRRLTARSVAPFPLRDGHDVP